MVFTCLVNESKVERDSRLAFCTASRRLVSQRQIFRRIVVMVRKSLRKPLLLSLVSLALPLASALSASGAELDLTGGMAGLTCTAGTAFNAGGNTTACQTANQGLMPLYYRFAGALWSTTPLSSTGTGVINSFVRIQDNTDVVDGHNTDGVLLNQEKAGSWTHDVRTSTVGTATIGGVLYYEFLLDINQNGSDPLIALSGLQICTSSAAGLSFVDGCSGIDSNQNQPANSAQGSAALKYDMDAMGGAGNTNTVLLDYSDNSGSGSGDLFVYIPATLLPSNDANNTYLYLWSQFGIRGTTGDARYTNNDGYEEWAFLNSGAGAVPSQFNVNAPEPATLIMLGTGLLLGGGAIRRRSRKATNQS